MSAKARSLALIAAASLTAAAFGGIFAALAGTTTPAKAAGAAGASDPTASTGVAEFAGSHAIHPVCLIGTWNLLDIDTYMQTLFSSSRIQIQNVSGNLRLRFSDDGQMEESTDGITVTALAGSDTIVETISGDLMATYVEEPSGTLSLSGMTGSFLVNASLNGIPFLENRDISDLLVGSGNPSFQYDCDGDRMSWQPRIPGRTVAPIVFNRGG